METKTFRFGRENEKIVRKCCKSLQLIYFFSSLPPSLNFVSFFHFPEKSTRAREEETVSNSSPLHLPVYVLPKYVSFFVTSARYKHIPSVKRRRRASRLKLNKSDICIFIKTRFSRGASHPETWDSNETSHVGLTPLEVEGK